MAESFELPVWYKDKALTLSAELRDISTSHRIIVYIEGVPFLFEPDEERNYRGLVAPEHLVKAEKIDRELLQVIADTLHDLFTN